MAAGSGKDVWAGHAKGALLVAGGMSREAGDNRKDEVY